MEQEDIYWTSDQDNIYSMESLDCPVCLESYDEGLHTPKMMPCLHTLCASCITNLASGTKGQKHGAGNPSTTSTRNTSVHGDVLQNHPILRRLSGQGYRMPETRQPYDLSPSSIVTSPGSSSAPSIHTSGVPMPIVPTAPTLIADTQMGGYPASVKRPEMSPPQPPKPGVAPLNPEPEIPKETVVQCPLCRSNVNTSRLQTNRYVLAHMRDLRRFSHSQLSHSSTSSASTEQSVKTSTFMPQEYWCEECKHLAADTCAYHELTPIAKWMELQEAMLESLKMAVDDQLGQHTSYLESLESMVKDVFRSLNKASRFIWDAKKQVQAMKEELENQSVTPATVPRRELAEALIQKMSWLEGAAERASQRNLIEGNKEVLVSFHQQQQQLFVLTYNPDLAVTITIAQGHTRV